MNYNKKSTTIYKILGGLPSFAWDFCCQLCLSPLSLYLCLSPLYLSLSFYFSHLFLYLTISPIYLSFFLFLPSISLSLYLSISLSLFLSPLSLYLSHLSLYLSISPIYLSIFLFLPSISLSFYFSHLSLSSIFLFLPSVSLSLPSISISPPPPPPLSFQIRNSLLKVQFPALDPSLATTHLYSRYHSFPLDCEKTFVFSVFVFFWKCNHNFIILFIRLRIFNSY